MTKPKAQTCKFNENRASYHIALPWCGYLKQSNILLPPFVLIERTVYPEDCKKCKCYQRAEE
jgi:hypothetical protein